MSSEEIFGPQRYQSAASVRAAMKKEQSVMNTQTGSTLDKMVFRKTNAKTGRQVAVTPQNSTMRHLAYGRIILNSSAPSASFSSAGRETGLICLSGRATVKTGGAQYELRPYDAIYIPRDSKIEVSTQSAA